MKRSISSVILILILFCACSMAGNDTKYKTATIFLTLAKQQNINAIIDLHGNGLSKKQTFEQVKEQIYELSGYLKQYGIPNEKDYFKSKDSDDQFTIIIVPIFKSINPNDDIQKVTVELTFMNDLGDGKIAFFDLNVDHKKNDLIPPN